MTPPPKIFISYCWSSPNHQEWVISLAERLVSDGTDVTIDKWDLKEGQDKFMFMENMVKSEDIHRVLIILDRKYTEKAEQRTGGVGTETQIISPKIYSDVAQEKFIPIIAEKDVDGSAFVPTYLDGRIYIDLSEQDRFEENYEALLRNIFQRPEFRKPKIGAAPSYLFDETPMTHRTSIMLRSFDNQITKSPKRANAIIREFIETFFHDLKGYSANVGSTRDVKTFGKKIYDSIISYTPLRNDYILFLDKLLKAEVDYDIDIIIKFFERLPLLTDPQDNRSSWTPSEFDNFRFFIHEIFLYTITVALKNEHYDFIHEILYSGYFFQDRFDRVSEPQRYDKLYKHINIIDVYYKQTYTRDFISPMADLLIKRVPDTLTMDDLIDADLVCHYVATLEKLEWFPVTYIYRTRGDRQFELLKRLVSQRHFEKVKILFNVRTADELKAKLKNAETTASNNRTGYSRSFDRITPIYQLVDINNIATIR